MSDVQKNDPPENDLLQIQTPSYATESAVDIDTINDLLDRLSRRRASTTTWDPDFDIDIDRVIISLNEQLDSLSLYIDQHWDDLGPNQLARLLTLFGQNATRIGHLLRDRCAILGPPKDPLDVIMTEAYAVASLTLGVHLLGPDGLSDLDAPQDQIPVDFDEIIADLEDKQDRLSHHIQSQQHDWNTSNLSRLFTVYGQNATRLGRLLRYRHAMYGEGLDDLNAIAAAKNRSTTDLHEWLDNVLAEPE